MVKFKAMFMVKFNFKLTINFKLTLDFMFRFNFYVLYDSSKLIPRNGFYSLYASDIRGHAVRTFAWLAHPQSNLECFCWL
jgi:hypothetical protein